LLGAFSDHNRSRRRRHRDAGLGLVTLRNAYPLMGPEVALIIERPAFTPLAKPALLISPAAGLLLDQITVRVQSPLCASEYVHVAVNGCMLLVAMEAVEGVTVTLARLTLVESNVAVTVQSAAGILPA
jgi:hypothetical protein